MNYSIYLLLVLVLAVALAVAVVIRSQFDKAPASKPRVAPEKPRRAARVRVPPRDPYRATSIHPGDRPCDAAQRMARQRFLVAGEAIPRLPLEACDQALCTCTYDKHLDRRFRHEERRAIGGLNPSLLAQRGMSERRSGRERRSEALTW